MKTTHTLQAAAADAMLAGCFTSANNMAWESEYRAQAASIRGFANRLADRQDSHPERKLCVTLAELRRLLEECDFCLEVVGFHYPSAAMDRLGAICDRVQAQLAATGVQA